MSKIFFLLVATAVCANADLLTDTSDTEETLLSQYNLDLEMLGLLIPVYTDDIKKMTSAGSDHVTTADAVALTQAQADAEATAETIAAGTGGTATEASAKFAATADDVESKMLAHLNAELAAAGGTDTTISRAIEKLTGGFTSIKTRVDDLLSTATKINDEVRSTVYTKLNNSLAEVNSALEEVVTIITEASADSEKLTTTDADNLKTAVNNVLESAYAILGGSDETGSEAVAELKALIKSLKSKIGLHYSYAAEKAKVWDSTVTILATTHATGFLDTIKTQLDAIVAVAPKIAAMESA